MQPDAFHVELLLLIQGIGVIGTIGVLSWFFAQALVTWLSPFALAAERFPLVFDRACDPVLVDWAASLGVRFYTVPSLDRDYAFSCFLGFTRVVVIAWPFYRHAPDPVVRFVIAHELAHHELGHVGRRMFITILRLQHWPVLWRLAHRLVAHDENAANELAEKATDLPRSIVWALGPNVVSVRGGTAQNEERSA